MHRVKLHKMAVKLSHNTSNPPHYLSRYNRARSKAVRKMTDNQRQTYEAMAKEWTENKLPPEVQQRYAHGNDSSRLGLTYFSPLVI